jgi:hypothetical protein
VPCAAESGRDVDAVGRAMLNPHARYDENRMGTEESGCRVDLVLPEQTPSPWGAVEYLLATAAVAGFLSAPLYGLWLLANALLVPEASKAAAASLTSLVPYAFGIPLVLGAVNFALFQARRSGGANAAVVVVPVVTIALLLAPTFYMSSLTQRFTALQAEPATVVTLRKLPAEEAAGIAIKSGMPKGYTVIGGWAMDTNAPSSGGMSINGVVVRPARGVRWQHTIDALLLKDPRLGLTFLVYPDLGGDISTQVARYDALAKDSGEYLKAQAGTNIVGDYGAAEDAYENSYFTALPPADLEAYLKVQAGGTVDASKRIPSYVRWPGKSWTVRQGRW